LAAAHAAQRGLIERVQALEAELEAAQERRTDSATKEDALASLRRQLKSLKEEALMSEERIEELTAAQAEFAAVRQRECDQLHAAERACAEATAAAARWQQGRRTVQPFGCQRRREGAPRHRLGDGAGGPPGGEEPAGNLLSGPNF
jgi:predicted  nucleic acid-binding Zn-ribbon protein